MFTGLIEETGSVKRAQKSHGALELTIAAARVLDDLAVDDSIAVNGVCLTIVKTSDADFDVQAVAETLRKTTLGSIVVGSKVNLERSLRPSDRMGGHFVQGHVDDIGQIVNVQSQAGGKLVALEFPARLTRYVISEGSIAVDGVSLTVARLSGNVATIALIPHTLVKTTLGSLKVGNKVNIEVDLIGKYIESLLPNSNSNKLSQQWLQEIGFE
ncbi:MAG: riboflavin synthase [bacterium]